MVTGKPNNSPIEFLQQLTDVLVDQLLNITCQLHTMTRLDHERRGYHAIAQQLLDWNSRSRHTAVNVINNVLNKVNSHLFWKFVNFPTSSQKLIYPRIFSINPINHLIINSLPTLEYDWIVNLRVQRKNYTLNSHEIEKW